MESISFFPSFLRMLSALIIVLGIMIGGTYLIRKYFLPTISDAVPGAAITILATRYVGQKSSIVLLDILGQLVVVGVANNQLSLITTISDPTARDRLGGLTRKTEEIPSLIDGLARYRDRLLSRKYTGKDERGK